MSLGHLHEEILEAAEHLPESSALVVAEVPWDDYEQLLEHLAERPRFRLSYDGGRLEIVSPSQKHEACLRFIEDLAKHIELSKTHGQTRALNAFIRRIRSVR
jgi:Uma2 family endonuclease